jgi:Fe-S cluster assembly protein SufD
MDIKDTYKETINLEKDSELNYNLKPNSFARLFFYDRAGVDVKINVNLEENASCEMYGFFKNEGKNPKVITTVTHKGKQSKCDQDFRFVNKECESSFEGKITIPKGVTGCESHMLNKNLLLDDESFAFSKPELDIKNDDTICSHGATTGPLDEQQIFYLQSRGIAEPQAIEMLIEAFYQDIKLRMEEAV